MSDVYQYILKITDKASPVFDKAGKAAGVMNNRFERLNNNVDRFNAKMKVSFTTVAAGATAVVGAMALATKAAGDYQNEFLELKNLNLDKTTSQLNDLDKSIKRVSFEQGLNPKETVKAFYDVQSATGLYGEEVDKIVTKVGRFSIATKADLNESINSTTKAMKAFGLSTDELDGYLESSAKTVQVGITTFDELAKVQTEYAGAAAAAGQTVNTANKVFAAMTAISKDSATAATATKSAFQGLTADNTVKGLKEIGVNVFDASGQMRDMDEVIRDLVPRLKGMNDQQFLDLRNSIGGPEGLQNLMNQLKTSGDDVINTLDAFDQSKFNIDEALKNAQGDFNTLSNIVQNRFNVVLTELGEVILPYVAIALNSIGDGIIWLRENTESYMPVLKALGAGLLTSGIAWGAIMLASKGYAASLAIARVATIAFTKGQMLLNLVLTANPIGIVIVAIGALVAAITWAYNEFEEFRGVVWGLWEAFKTAFGNIGALASETFGGIGDLIVGALTFDVDKLKQGLTRVMNASMTHGKKIREAFKKGYDSQIGKEKVESASSTGAAKVSNPTLDDTIPLPDATVDDSKNGINDISKGGSRQTTVNITYGDISMAENINVQELTESLDDYFEKFKELNYRVFTSVANLSNG
ncbi:phage tail tape measure protein [Flammeovirga sp. MY04]|uniref:phage tail tape measure protein n=1 Tax=Flammeovirga sp. MY04 TaxID=1191459 RepID=UPI000806446A|nr:phage tail tape measure protein [Flammeovirga sp. MY04]ANQ49617.1 phage tail tape measure protein [Flammeovirga sp. MY04]ANQ52135.1 phage tail tape measure protein [Flammeovirga sp. MY04]